MRPVRASGKASAAKATRCTNLSLHSGAGGGASIGQSIAMVSVRAVMSVRGMSRDLRMPQTVRGIRVEGKSGLTGSAFALGAKAL